jgi:outer membrane protein assembly factor BamB
MRVAAVAMAIALVLPTVRSAAPPASAPRVLVALDQRDGSVLWRAKSGGADGGHLDAKYVTHGLLVTEERRCLSGERASQPGDTSVVAFDARSGRERWRTADVELPAGSFGRIDPPSAGVTTLPARSTVTGDWELLDVSTGHVAAPLDSVPVAASGDLLLVVNHDAFAASASTRGIVTAVDRRTGAARWTKNLGANLFSLSADAGSVAVASGPIPDPGTELGQAGGVEVLDAATGQRRWAAPLMPAYGVELAGGKVVFQNLDHLRAVDAATGAPAWDSVTDGTLDPDLVPDRTLVVVGGPGTGGSNRVIGGSVSAYDTASGTRRWTRTFRGLTVGFGTGPAVVAGTDRRVTGFDTSRGRRLWTRAAPAHTSAVVTGNGRVYVSGGCTVSSE